MVRVFFPPSSFILKKHLVKTKKKLFPQINKNRTLQNNLKWMQRQINKINKTNVIKLDTSQLDKTLKDEYRKIYPGGFGQS